MLSRKDNHVIFIKINGKPYDQGSFEYMKRNKLPKYSDLMLNRTRVNEIGNKILIALPIKLNDREEIIQEDIESLYSVFIRCNPRTWIKFI